jgi:hypothetical protein
MLILLLATCLLPFLLGDLIARFILVHPLIGIAFLIGWAALSFLLHGYYKKRTLIISLHAAGIMLLVCQCIPLTSKIPFLFSAVQWYFLPAMQFNILPISRLFYLIFGQVTVVHMYCTSLLFMVIASYIGCILRKKLPKSQ